MPNPAIRFGWSPNARTRPTAWVDGEWLPAPVPPTSLRTDPRVHVSSRVRIYVTGIRAWVNDEPQDSTTAALTVHPTVDDLAAGDGGRDKAWWLWAEVIGVQETPVEPIGAIRVYGT